MNTSLQLGFLGLGQMGQPMANNIAKAGFPLHVFDPAGTEERAPEGAMVCDALEVVAAAADTVFLSLPDGPVSLSVVDQIIAAPMRRCSVIVDLSTIGPDAAAEAGGKCAPAGITYIDAPVSGGQAGAIAASITVMWGGPKAEMERHQDILNAFSKNQFYVGDAPGQGQTVKILNNFLSATAMAATTEAVLFGLSQGIDMKTMLDVVNVSSGQNTASRDKFPQRVLTGTFDAGFKSALLAKDVRLFLENAQKADTPNAVGQLISGIWNDCDEALPGSDFTRVYEFLRDR